MKKKVYVFYNRDEALNFAKFILNAYPDHEVCLEYDFPRSRYYLVKESFCECKESNCHKEDNTKIDNKNYIDQLLGKVYANNARNSIDSLIKNIAKVIFHDPATVIYWKNGDKTVVKCGKNDIFDPEKGLIFAIMKYIYGNENDYYMILKKYISKNESKEHDKKIRDLRNIMLNDSKEITKNLTSDNCKDMIDEK